MPREPYSTIEIGSLKDLAKHEKEILDRINGLPNGGNLFMAHPFLLLEDVGVDLADRVRDALVRADPYLSGLSETPYRALKRSRRKQAVRYRVNGLFRRSRR